MDVAAAAAALPADTDLFDFIESLEREEKFVPITTTTAAAAAVDTTVDAAAISDSSYSTINN